MKKRLLYTLPLLIFLLTLWIPGCQPQAEPPELPPPPASHPAPTETPLPEKAVGAYGGIIIARPRKEACDLGHGSEEFPNTPEPGAPTHQQVQDRPLTEGLRIQM